MPAQGEYSYVSVITSNIMCCLAGVGYLLTTGAKVTQRDITNKTPLHLAMGAETTAQDAKYNVVLGILSCYVCPDCQQAVSCEAARHHSGSAPQ